MSITWGEERGRGGGVKMLVYIIESAGFRSGAEAP